MKPGDVVQLKSGGPAMTVSEVSGTQVTCTWFDGTKPCQRGFLADTLQPYQPRSINVPVKHG
jgi:uncharacterized protein YodC (DUF2158 family)